MRRAVRRLAVIAGCLPALAHSQAFPGYGAPFSITGPGSPQAQVFTPGVTYAPLTAPTASQFDYSKPEGISVPTQKSPSAMDFSNPVHVATASDRQNYTFHACVQRLANGSAMNVDEGVISACRRMTHPLADAPTLKPLLNSDGSVKAGNTLMDDYMAMKRKEPSSSHANAPPLPSELEIQHVEAACDASHNLTALLNEKCLDAIHVEVRDGKTTLLLNAPKSGQSVSPPPQQQTEVVSSRVERLLASIREAPQAPSSYGNAPSPRSEKAGLSVEVSAPVSDRAPSGAVIGNASCVLRPSGGAVLYSNFTRPAQCVAQLKALMGHYSHVSVTWSPPHSKASTSNCSRSRTGKITCAI